MLPAWTSQGMRRSRSIAGQCVKRLTLSSKMPTFASMSGRRFTTPPKLRALLPSLTASQRLSSIVWRTVSMSFARRCSMISIVVTMRVMA